MNLKPLKFLNLILSILFLIVSIYSALYFMGKIPPQYDYFQYLYFQSKANNEDTSQFVPSAAERVDSPSGSAVYLYDLDPIQYTTGVKRETDVIVRGVEHDRCYRFSSTLNRTLVLEFNIGPDKSKLNYGFGFDDNHGTSSSKEWNAELVVKGDGKNLIDPFTILTTDQPAYESISVKGIIKLTFYVTIHRGTLDQPEIRPILIDPVVE